MSELRYDPIKGTWVILSTERGRRPSDYHSHSQALPEPSGCPFCPGNEAMTPREVFSLRPPGTAPDGPGWRIRVVPNKFPALTTELPFDELPPAPWEEAVHKRIPGFGSHEIIIETSERNRQMADMEPQELAEVLTVYRARMQTHFEDGRFKTVILFKNHGQEAGASLIHSHSQLVAMPVVPDHVASQLRAFSRSMETDGICLMCNILDRETSSGTRVVLDEGGYLVVAPFSAASPFQVNVIPRIHSHDFSLLEDAAIRGLASALGSTLRRLYKVLGEHPWNMILHNAPVELPDRTDTTVYHWFLEITPRLTNPAGFEMGSGFSINTVAPEECASLLRGEL